MNINEFILEKSMLKEAGSHKPMLNLVDFAILHSIDVDCYHIPKWFKTLRIFKLLEFFVAKSLITKDQLLYTFTPIVDSGTRHTKYKLYEIFIEDVEIETAELIRQTIMSPDIIKYIKFNVESATVFGGSMHYMKYSNKRTIRGYLLDVSEESVNENLRI